MMLSAKASKSDYLKAIGTLLLGLCILGACMIVLGGNWFWVKYDFYDIRFLSIKDLSRGRVVKYAGLDVGRVDSITLDVDDPHYILVRVALQKGFPLFQGTVARIAQKGLVGDYYVLLELRGKPGARLAPGDSIQAVTTMDMQELAAKAGELLDDIRPKINDIAANIDKLFSEQNTDSLRRALEGTPKLVEEFQLAARDFRQNWVAWTTKGVQTAESLDTTLKRVDKAVGKVETELAKTLQTFRAQADGVGALVADVRQGVNYDQEQLEDILKNLNRTSRDVKELMSRLRERPWELIRPPSGSGK
jgi:phospholipid/cholesterol/gamma-HCH transport system substrate-binding protein